MPEIPEKTPEVPDLYGNAPVGEHEATFVGASLHPFRKGKRLVAKFLCLTPDRGQALELDGAAACAVAVCNDSEGTNPKSKPFKIRQAMLEANEFDPIESAVRVPSWEHFLTKTKDGSRRCLGVCVRIKNAANGQISLVSHIRRPRDGVWQEIEGKFEGKLGMMRLPFVNKDGTVPPFNGRDPTLKDLAPHLPMVWEYLASGRHNAPKQDGEPFWTEDGQFKPIELDAAKALRTDIKARYLAIHHAKFGNVPML